jgi:hypothetical protein
MRRLAEFLVAVALVTGCDAATEPVNNDPELLKQHEGEIVRQPVSDVIENPCSGELVTITGEELHVFNGASPDPESGQFTNLEDLFQASGTGLGETGTQYVFSAADHFIFDSPSPPAPQGTFTAESRFIVTSKAGDANFVEHVTFHITFTPDGPPRITTDFDNAECRSGA